MFALVLLVVLTSAEISSIAFGDSSHRDLAPKAYLFESFDSPDWKTRWVHSTDEKYSGRFETANGELKIPMPHKFYGLSALLNKPLDPSKGLVDQYETAYTKGYECGGSYLKLLTYDEGFSPSELHDETPYSVMFGPDKCGEATDKIHMILRHQSPLDGSITEKHRKPQPKLPSDKLPHVYTLIIKPDASEPGSPSMQILLDGEVKALGSLLENMEPPINPPPEIPDPADLKPKDWVDNPKIPDASARRPENWDTRKVIVDTEAKKPSGWLDNEPTTVPNKAAKKPSGWDEEEDGEWEPPRIPNPKCKKVGCGPWKPPTKANPDYKGEWRAPLIDNPDYKGPWVQAKIPNPDHHVDPEPLNNIGLIGAVAFELWTIDEGYSFDNIYVGQDPDEAERLRKELWDSKFRVAKKKADEDAKLAEAAAKRKADAEVGGIKGLPNLILRAFDSGALKDYKSYVAPVLDAIRATPQLVYLAIIVPVLLILVWAFRSSGVSVPKDARSKKFDIPDDEDEDEDDNLARTEKKKKAADVTAHEITPADDDDEDDDEDEAKKGARRRTRRAA